MSAAVAMAGTLHRVSGDLAQAQRCHQQALDLARAIASSRNQAHALPGLGRCALAAGHASQAEALLRQALEIFQRIGAAEADDVARELTALTEAGHSHNPCHRHSQAIGSCRRFPGGQIRAMSKARLVMTAVA